MAPPIRVSYDSIANLQFSNPDSPIGAHVNKVMSVEAMIRRNFSTDALRFERFERDLENTTSTPSSGPDSPYSRMSRNLSQLLDDTDAEVDAKLMSRLQSTASLTNVRTAGAGQGYAGNLKKSLIVSTFDTISEDDLDGIMEALACYGPVHFKQHLTLSTFKVQFDHSADAEQAQAALDGHVMYPSGKLIRVSIEWVGHVHEKVTDEMIKKAFQVHGPVESVKRVEGKSCAFVTFQFIEHAVIARKALNNSRLGGGIIKTGFAKSSNGSPTETGSDHSSLAVSHLTSPVLDTDSLVDVKQEPEKDAYLYPIPALPNDLMVFDPVLLKEIRIELEHGTELFVDEQYRKFAQSLTALAVDPMGNIVVQKLVERGDLDRRIEILQSLKADLPALSCHKNGTWVVQKFISLAAIGDADLLKQGLMDALNRYLVELLKDQYGNYVVQGCLGLGGVHTSTLLRCLIWRLKDLAKARFGSRAVKSIMEAISVNANLRSYLDEIVNRLVQQTEDLVLNPHGAMLICFLISHCDKDRGINAVILDKILANQNAIMNRHAQTVLLELARRDYSLCDLVLGKISRHEQPGRLVSDQSTCQFIVTLINLNKNGPVSLKFEHPMNRVTCHSDEHRANLEHLGIM